MLAVRLDHLDLRMSPAELNILSTAAELRRGGGGVILDKKSHPHLPVVAGEDVFVKEGFVSWPLECHLRHSTSRGCWSS